MASEFCIFGKAMAVSESPPRVPTTAAGSEIHLEAIRQAVNQGLDSGRDVNIEGCQTGDETTDHTRSFSEEMESLLSLIEIARLGFSSVATKENAEFEINIGGRNTETSSDSSANPFTTSRDTKVLIRKDRDDDPVLPPANDARYHLEKQDPHPGAQPEVVESYQSPEADRLGGAGLVYTREAMSEMVRNIHGVGQHPKLQQQKPSEALRRLKQEDPQLEEVLRNGRRSRVRHSQKQWRNDEGRGLRRRRIPEHVKQKKVVSATGQGLNTDLVKDICGRVSRNRTGRFGLEAGDNFQTSQSEKEPSPQRQTRRTCWKKRQEALAALEGRIRSSAEINDTEEIAALIEHDDGHLPHKRKENKFRYQFMISGLRAGRRAIAPTITRSGMVSAMTWEITKSWHAPDDVVERLQITGVKKSTSSPPDDMESPASLQMSNVSLHVILWNDV
ncbi:hypothetical protein LX32DRAFT_701911 [Colletotrichum zoysiae]|uniref:Uncharacterized protein n=1 Tax=Colletotrichum zoysiae TaxID=1216348 RepID=A0AAD9LZ21_9PEZI|nr:hypothetical protein LX32DRAFT_701911 [Colletotrichum zoysiae]